MNSSDLLGPRAPRPQTRRQARSLLKSIFSRFALIAGGAPAVPANLLNSFTACLLIAQVDLLQSKADADIRGDSNLTKGDRAFAGGCLTSLTGHLGHRVTTVALAAPPTVG